MRWMLKSSPDAQSVKQLSNDLNLDKSSSALLIQRGLDHAEKAKEFLNPNLDELHDPFLMKGMQKAVDRIISAIANGETIMVFGDYDADGITSVALVSSFLSESHFKILTYIPDRYTEGYGISYRGIDVAYENSVSLIIALDCGIKAVDEIAYAKNKHIDFIVCDHHFPEDRMPDAIAILNPKQEDCPYPYDGLSGCGIGFKLIQGLSQNRGNRMEDLYPYLDLVAISIAADLVPMDGENRILTHHGLIQLNENPRIGLKILMGKINKKFLNISDLVFNIAPRINSTGRIKKGIYAVQFLNERDEASARKMMEKIEQWNNQRRELDKKTTYEALEQIRENKEESKMTTIVYREDWHKGVIGIVASRLIEMYYRPTLVFTKVEDKFTASARSVSGFDIYKALNSCADCIEQFGGHKYAAGLTLLSKNYEKFKKLFNEVVDQTFLEEDKERKLVIDSEISLDDISLSFYKNLSKFAPFGPSNMKPVFKISGLKYNQSGKRIGKVDDKNKLPEHLHLDIFSESSQKKYRAIGFKMGDKLKALEKCKTFAIAFNLEKNEWNGSYFLQLNLKDIKTENE